MPSKWILAGYEATNKDVLQKAVKVAINIGPAMVVY